MAFWDIFRTKAVVETVKEETLPAYATQLDNEGDIFKAYIPWYLYKPPFGYPREVNPLQLRLLGKNPYIFSVVKTLQDRVASTKYGIRLKKEYAEKKIQEDEVTKLQIEKFFERPNGNDNESFETILRAWVKDISELDAGVGIKVFNTQGEFSQLFARDGGTFLLNPDIHGYFGDRDEFVEPLDQQLLVEGIKPLGELKNGNGYGVSKEVLEQNNKQFRNNKKYDNLYKESAAFFQYGWTAGARPIPFGKREVIYIMTHPRTESIYGRSPLEVLYETILTLIYGGEYNLDFYLNNNLPTGVLTAKGASQAEANAIRTTLRNYTMESDVYGNTKKKHFKVPISNREFSWLPMQMSSNEMQVIEQQKWFTKLVWACFGVTSDEMGFTEDSNKAISENQSRVSERRAIRPLLSAIQHAINTQLMPEFNAPEYEFAFIEDDIDGDIKKHQLWEQQIRMGVRSAKQIATEELNISEEDFQQAEEEKKQQMIDQGIAQGGEPGDQPTDRKEALRSQLREKLSAKALKVPEAQNIDNLIEKALEEIEQEITGYVTKEFNERPKIKGFVDIKSKTSKKIDKIVSKIIGTDFDKKLNQELHKILSKAIEKTEKQLGINTSIKPNKEFKDYFIGIIKGMNDDLLNKAKQVVGRSLLQGNNKLAVIQELQTVFNVTKSRAETITRTEITRALNLSAKDVADDSGLELMKVWDAKLDNKTSDICKSLDGKAIPLNEKFNYKGKDYDLPPAHPNCRSLLRFEQLNKKEEK